MGPTAPWDWMLRRMLWEQLAFVRGCRVLDYGSGTGITSDYLAQWNEVVAIEPDERMIAEYAPEHAFTQLHGGAELLDGLPDGSFDVILCHNVLEYAQDRERIVRQLGRLLRRGGTLSIVKHNRLGRVMQMAVLLDAVDEAHALLDGQDSQSARFGAIRYYEDEDIPRWCPALQMTACHGIRTFWDLQQRQEKHADPAWQERMLSLQRRVSDMDELRRVAFFHHLTFVRG